MKTWPNGAKGKRRVRSVVRALERRILHAFEAFMSALKFHFLDTKNEYMDQILYPSHIIMVLSRAHVTGWKEEMGMVTCTTVCNVVLEGSECI